MINKLHGRAIRNVLNDQTRNFETLLAETSNICNHHRNIQTLKIEAYKIQNNLAPPKLETMLERKTIPYNLRDPQEIVTQRKRTVNYGLEPLISRHPQL